ncbi:MAG TPA: hydantoinase B/oxoprolinase family protein, partial [Candidatus Binatia bacterium]
QNAIDLRAKISANTIMQRRFCEAVERYGLEEIRETMARMIDTTETRLRSLLSEIPDGSWSDVAYLDYFDRERLEIYVCRLTLTKEGDCLTFDFSGSSQQAPGVINVTLPALEGYVIRAVMAVFGFAIAPCPGGVFRVCRVLAEPGTFVNCSWPAGVCKGTTSGTYAVFQAVTSCLGQMMSGGRMEKRATTALRGHMALLDFSGTDQYGQRFAGVFTDCGLGAGGGARGTQDGIDTGSGSEPEVSIPNVETNELRYPMLYLYRRQGTDSAGAGKHRGGAGIAVAIKPHGVASIPHLILHSHGIACPSSLGLEGGYPGACNEMVILRGSKASSLFQRGIVPQSLDVLEGEKEVPKAFGRNWLDGDDVFHCSASGGGGWGDPLERDPREVERDVKEGLVSVKWAKELYGVECDPSASLDVEGTVRMRDGIRRKRVPRSALDTAPVEAASYPAFVGDVADIEGKLRGEFRGQCRGCRAPLSHRSFFLIPWTSVSPYCGCLAADGLFELAGWFCDRCLKLDRVKCYPRGGHSQ